MNLLPLTQGDIAADLDDVIADVEVRGGDVDVLPAFLAHDWVHWRFGVSYAEEDVAYVLEEMLFGGEGWTDAEGFYTRCVERDGSLFGRVSRARCREVLVAAEAWLGEYVETSLAA